MIGYAVQIVRQDGSTFFAIPGAGFATPVFFTGSQAREHAARLRKYKFKCRVVRVDYSDPVPAPRKRSHQEGK